MMAFLLGVTVQKALLAPSPICQTRTARLRWMRQILLTDSASHSMILSTIHQNKKTLSRYNFPELLSLWWCKKGDKEIHPAGITDGSKMNFVRQYSPSGYN